MFQEYKLDAETEIDIANKSCEEMELEIARGEKYNGVTTTRKCFTQFSISRRTRGLRGIAGVESNQRGFIPTDKFQVTNVDNIFALGDATVGVNSDL
jgi:pyruvate/2-oxoglutarate dehydrogenase complex dihydrolipoamide dehydrogenase (E3) component